MEERIQVNKPFLPPLELYQEMVADIWSRNWLTNDGPLVRQLETELQDHFDSEHVIFVSNGTIALQLALHALHAEGEVITTPFSYVASTTSILWQNCSPVFVDIDPETLTIDPGKIERAISDKTTAILATHVFGNPCDIKAIEEIAGRYNLKVIYDAAHCFNTTYEGRSIMTYGDLSCISFHATKLFHTIEGGAVATNDPQLADRLRKARNFGHNGPLKFKGVGINGKNSEFHAAMGLVNLSFIDSIQKRRQEQSKLYRDLLQSERIIFPKVQNKAKINNAYCALLLDSEVAVLRVEKVLSDVGIGSRRYFYPSLNTLDYVEAQSCPISEDIARRVLCLPLYHELTDGQIEEICQHLLNEIHDK